MPLILDTPSEASLASQPDVFEERRRLHHDADVVIVGAGILGASLAVALADTGRSVILLEKSLKEPDRIVGELLQPGGVEALTQLGLRDCLEEIDAVKVRGYNIIYKGEPVEISYPKNAAQTVVENASHETRVEGRSFHHGRFVAKLRAAAMSHPNISVFETEVTSTIAFDHSLQSQVIGVETFTRKTEKKDFFFGALTVICDGYASKFRKQYSRHTPVAKSKFWGLELIDCPLPLPLHGQVVLSPTHAPILLYQIGTHETRVLVDVPEGTPTASLANGGVKSHLQNHILPVLPSQVRPSFADALEKGGLRSMPNSFLPPTTNRTPGLVLLGDALNMRHPLTGGGMTVALNDVLLLKTLLSPATVPDLEDTTLVLKQLSKFHWRRKDLTAVINILAQALYSLFAANDPQLRYLQAGCFAYFKKGGNCIDGPVGLLAGIIRQPFVLFYHFFAVAVLSIWVMVKEGGVLGFVSGKSFVEGIMVFVKACGVLFPFIWAELRT